MTRPVQAAYGPSAANKTLLRQAQHQLHNYRYPHCFVFPLCRTVLAFQIAHIALWTSTFLCQNQVRWETAAVITCMNIRDRWSYPHHSIVKKCFLSFTLITTSPQCVLERFTGNKICLRLLGITDSKTSLKHSRLNSSSSELIQVVA